MSSGCQSGVKAVVTVYIDGVYQTGLAGESAPKATFRPDAAQGTEMWQQAICTELGVNPEEYYVLLTEGYTSTIDIRKKMAQLLFDALKVKGLQFAPRAVLPLYAAGQLTGVVVDASEQDIYIVPVKDGFAVQDAILKVPSGDSKGLGKFLYLSVSKCEEGIRTKLLQNIVIAGANPLYADLPKTLDKELRAAVPQGTTFNIKAPATRDTSIWLGGSILADVEPFQEKWINREEYQQTGPDIITNKQICPPLAPSDCRSGAKAVVMEISGGVCRAGLAGDSAPQAVFQPKVSDLTEVCQQAMCTELKLKPEDYCVLLADAYTNTSDYRKKMAQVMFETFKVKGLQFAPRAVLPLYAAGHLTGVVVDTSEQDIYIVPVNDGFAVQDAILKVPSGDCKSLGKFLYLSVSKCEEGMRTKLLQHIVVTGANPLYADLPERLDRELKSALPSGTEFNITVPATRDISVWIGGSILASIEPFQEKWIMKEEYQQKGPEVITEKQICPPLAPSDCRSGAKAVVMEISGGVCQAGLAGDSAPQAVFQPKVSDLTEVCQQAMCTELKLKPEDYCVLLADAYTNTSDYRKKMAQVMFETFKVKGLQFAPRAVLPLYAAGHLTGVVVDSSEQDIYIVPVNDGFAVQDAIQKVPSGDSRSLGEYLYLSVSKCEEGIRTKLIQHIVIAGANPLYADLPERLDRELKSALPSGTEFNITVPATRDISVWIGGSILASIEPFQEKWIMKEEYQQKGPNVIQEKHL